MYEHVAVPLDGSEAALSAIAPARRLAAAFDAELVFVSVATPAVERAGGTAAVFSEALGRLAAVDTTDGAAARPAVVELDRPDAAATLGRFDADDPRTLVCMSTTGRGALGRAVLGSTALSVVRHSPFAVVLVGPRCGWASTGPVGPIVTCLDGSRDAEVVLPWVEAWARHTGATVELVRGVYPFGEPGAADPPTAEQIADLGYLGKIAARVRDHGVEVRADTSVVERPLGMILDAVDAAPDGVVALSTSHPGLVTGLLAGSNAADVVRRSTIPVLVASRDDTAG